MVLKDIINGTSTSMRVSLVTISVVILVVLGLSQPLLAISYNNHMSRETREPQSGTSGSPNVEAYMLWLAKHQVNVSRKLILSFNTSTGILSIKVELTVLEAFIEKLRNLTLTYRNVTIDTSQISLEKVHELLQALNLTTEEIKRLLGGETIIKDLGMSIEILTTANDPPHWCDWGYPAPQWTWSKHIICLDEFCAVTEIYYIAEDPINLILKIYPPAGYDEFTFIHEELSDEEEVYDNGTDDDWPNTLVQVNQYVYDCHDAGWKLQDRAWVEGDELEGQLSELADQYDRMHIRLWRLYSPVYGYIIIVNVHLENANFPSHELLHIGRNYWYAYEYAENFFSWEFSVYLLGPWWVSWNSSKRDLPLIITHNKTFAEKYGDIITSYYVYPDFDWKTYGSIYYNYVYLNNSKLYYCEYRYDGLTGEERYSCDYGSLQKDAGNGNATYIYYQAPSRPW